MTTEEQAKRSWRAAAEVYLHKRVIAMLFLGFSAGLPFLLVFSTLSAWLRLEDVSRTAIGFFSWVGLTYSIKVFWAPVVDRLPLPGLTRILGRRRAWMLLGMAGIAAGLLGMATTDPATDLYAMALFALLVAFSSATQDIAVDAYRIEAVQKHIQGAMAATYQGGYRIALLVAGGGALLLVDKETWPVLSWPMVYAFMACLTLVGMITVLLIREPAPPSDAAVEQSEERVVRFLERQAHLPAWARDGGAWFIGAVICPFTDFFRRNGMIALAILAFVGLFRVSDVLMGAMALPFYIDTGFTEGEIGSIVKVFGTIATMVGALAGGVVVMRFDVFKPLLAAAFLLPLTNILFAALAVMGPEKWMLYVTISADNFSAGLAGSAFIAYLSGLTSTAYTATQYALFSSLMTLPGKILAGFSGMVVDSVGYMEFFLYTALAGVPAVALVVFLGRRARRNALA
ncbi:MAG: AmpG family muropeptide MFS transporter [Alphaproteobacteria bacterium]|nr:AmpG family muropeptide MFS transporter [Alphaproteobacteria bacterium]